METLEQRMRDRLGDFWDERALPIGPGGTSIVEQLIAPVESMTAVDVLIDIDVMVGKKIPSTVIQAGGYMDRDEFINNLSARVLEYLEKQP